MRQHFSVASGFYVKNRVIVYTAGKVSNFRMFFMYNVLHMQAARVSTEKKRVWISLCNTRVK